MMKSVKFSLETPSPAGKLNFGNPFSKSPIKGSPCKGCKIEIALLLLLQDPLLLDLMRDEEEGEGKLSKKTS